MTSLVLPEACSAYPFSLTNPESNLDAENMYVLPTGLSLATLAEHEELLKDVTSRVRLIIPTDASAAEILAFWQTIYTPLTVDFNQRAHAIFHVDNAEVAVELIAHGVPVAIGTAHSPVQLASLMGSWMDGMEVRVESGQAAQQVYVLADVASSTDPAYNASMMVGSMYEAYLTILHGTRWQELSYSQAPPALLVWTQAGNLADGTVSYI